MRFEYTSALLFALQRASRRARMEQRQEVTCRDLLAGLLAEEEGMAAQMLLQVGFDLASYRISLGLGAESLAGDEDMLPFTLEVRSTLRQAQKLAALHSEEGSVTSDQTLLALLESFADLRQEFVAKGLDYQAFRGQIAREAEPIYLNEPLFPAEPTQTIDLARILDANGNRAREALRVLEDYARFVLDDPLLSEQAKRMRHDLAGVLAMLPAELLLEARDTLHDVGTAISTPEEWDRPTLQAVVEANAKRLQEALRSLEEFGKVTSAELGQSLEALRYRSYTLERALVLGGVTRQKLLDAKLYFLVSDALCRTSLVGTVKEAILGGVQVVQLREKNLDDRVLLAQARELRRMTRDHGVLFIVNDRPDIAVLAEADGVHLGQDDLPIREARRLLGPGTIIGISTHSVDQLTQAVLEGACYVGIGPTFPSQTKQFDSLAGLDYIREAVKATSLPAFALGGITMDNLGEVLAAGAKRIAVSQTLCAAEEPRRLARKLREMLDGDVK